ncbi:MAG: hypothetical protein ABI132_11730 [Rhodanobacteraceae bacterium]
MATHYSTTQLSARQVQEIPEGSLTTVRNIIAIGFHFAASCVTPRCLEDERSLSINQIDYCHIIDRFDILTA